MPGQTAEAIQNNEDSTGVLKAAADEAAENVGTRQDAESLAVEVYEKLAGRTFPQRSADRRAVYVGGMILIGSVFALTLLTVTLLALNDKVVPESIWTIATALGTGVLGGLFGYAQQK